jgi:hypothetical protein
MHVLSPGSVERQIIETDKKMIIANVYAAIERRQQGPYKGKIGKLVNSALNGVYRVKDCNRIF